MLWGRLFQGRKVLGNICFQSFLLLGTFTRGNDLSNFHSLIMTTLNRWHAAKVGSQHSTGRRTLRENFRLEHLTSTLNIWPRLTSCDLLSSDVVKAFFSEAESLRTFTKAKRAEAAEMRGEATPRQLRGSKLTG